jgi:hypothetical protein
MDLQQLAAVTLPDQNDERYRLGDLWHEQPTVLVFLRHFG